MCYRLGSEVVLAQALSHHWRSARLRPAIIYVLFIWKFDKTNLFNDCYNQITSNCTNRCTSLKRLITLPHKSWRKIMSTRIISIIYALFPWPKSTKYFILIFIVLLCSKSVIRAIHFTGGNKLVFIVLLVILFNYKCVEKWRDILRTVEI